MNSVYIDSALAASPIYIGPLNANAVNIGNTTSTTTIQGLAISTFGGNSLVAYNISTGVNATIPTGIEFGSVVDNNTNQGGKAYIDFHTNQKGFVDYDARIMSVGGSSVTPATTQASLNYYAASHYFAGNVNMGTGTNITLQPTTGFVTPTAGMLGNIISGATPTTTVMSDGTSNIVSSIILTETGIYMFSAILLISTNTTTLSTIKWISLSVVIGAGTPLLLEERVNQTPASTSINFALHLCGIVSNTGTNTYNLKLNSNFTGGAPSYTNFAFSYKAVRIA